MRDPPPNSSKVTTLMKFKMTLNSEAYEEYDDVYGKNCMNRRAVVTSRKMRVWSHQHVEEMGTSLKGIPMTGFSQSEASSNT